MINNKILSFYNTELQENIMNNVCLSKLRNKQMNYIIKLILNKIKNKNNSHSGLHIIIGSLYTDEIDNKNLLDIIHFYND